MLIFREFVVLLLITCACFTNTEESPRVMDCLRRLFNNERVTICNSVFVHVVNFFVGMACRAVSWYWNLLSSVIVIHCNLGITLILGAKQHGRYNEMHILNGIQRIVIDW